MPASAGQLQNHQPQQVSVCLLATPNLATKVNNCSLLICQAKTQMADCILELILFEYCKCHLSVSLLLNCLYGQAAAACRSVSDLIPKEKSNGLPVFTQALRLVPFSMPDHWSGPRLCEDLPGQYASFYQLATPCMTASVVIIDLGRTPVFFCAFCNSLHCSPFPNVALPTLAKMLTCSHYLHGMPYQLPKPLLPAAAAAYAMAALLQA